MSQENVEIVRSGYAQFAANGDLAVSLMSPDFVWDMSTFLGWPEQQLYHGADGTREFLAAWLECWDDWKLEVEGLHDAGDKIVAIVRQTARSKATGLPVDMVFAQVWTVRDGRQTRMQMYAEPDEAMRAVRDEP